MMKEERRRGGEEGNEGRLPSLRGRTRKRREERRGRGTRRVTFSLPTMIEIRLSCHKSAEVMKEKMFGRIQGVRGGQVLGGCRKCSVVLLRALLGGHPGVGVG